MKDKLTEEEKRLFERCLALAMEFAAGHQSGTALEYLEARKHIDEIGLEEKYRKWFFGEQEKV